MGWTRSRSLSMVSCQGVATSPPYVFDLDTLGLSSDRHELTAIAYDAAGNTASRRSVST